MWTIGWKEDQRYHNEQRGEVECESAEELLLCLKEEKSLIKLFQENHHLTIEELCKFFAQFNVEYICREMEPGADFDYVLYFPDQRPDAWYYCIRMEMGHTIYHRFTKEDYEQV